MKEKSIKIGRIGFREALSVKPNVDNMTVLKFAGISTVMMGGIIGLFNFCSKLPDKELNLTRVTTDSAFGLLFGVIATLGYVGIAARQRGWGRKKDSSAIEDFRWRHIEKPANPSPLTDADLRDRD